ncbi:MAG: sodium:proton antiporter [Sulfurospirillum sp.]|nr:MAG: sodium:proton antiporter [Sulfurospirillum sp.]
MIITLLLILTILFFAIEIQKHFHIPSPISLIVLSYLFYFAFPNHKLFSEDEFAELELFLIPILITSDALELKLNDLKRNFWSLLFLAVFAVVLSIVAGYLITDTLFGEYHLSTGAIIALFAMVLATDPVSVVSVFSNFKVPHKLKILAEGESLFNDATALIIFSFIALPMMQGESVGGVDIAVISLKVISISVLIGFLVGLIGIFLMQQTQDHMSELLLILITAYLSFEISEHFHVSGLLSVIVAVITLNHITEKSLKQAQRDIRRKRSSPIKQKSFLNTITNLTKKFKKDITTIDRHEQNLDYIRVLSLLANALLFISMASIVDIELLYRYQYEIFMMFVVTTLIRALIMAKFSIISNSFKTMTDINFRWWSVLLFSGIKGGLSIVMLTLLPDNFEHKEMFEAIVVGVILLSTFVYAISLVLIITKYKRVFEKEYELEHHKE